MTAVLAALPSIYQLIALAVPGVENLIAFVQSIRTTAQQSSQWTADQETAFLNALIAYEGAPEWKPDAPAAA